MITTEHPKYVINCYAGIESISEFGGCTHEVETIEEVLEIVKKYSEEDGGICRIEILINHSGGINFFDL